jgi:hypothetical protein
MFKPEFAFNNYLVRVSFKKRMPDTLNNCFILKNLRCSDPVSFFFNGRKYYSNSADYAGTNKNVYYFESLGLGYEQIKFTLLGVAGIYKLINKEDPSRFYIGSTVNLSRRLNEYINLTKGIRSPKSKSELEISQTSASGWILIILEITPPQLSLIHEQYALIKYEPTINKYFNVVPKINPQWEDIELALNRIKSFQSQFPKDSFGFIRFDKFLKAFTIAKEMDIENKLKEEETLRYSTLVFLYRKSLPDKEPIVYSSINKTLKSLFISYGSLIDCITNKYIFKEDLILSFEPLSSENIREYSYKLSGDNQLRKTVALFNDELEPAFEFNSAREMAKFFTIDGKKARSAISKGVYLDYTLITKEVSFRKEVFVFNSETFNLITELKSITAAIDYAKVNFYTMKSLLETNKPHNGKIYSYSKNFKP